MRRLSLALLSKPSRLTNGSFIFYITLIKIVGSDLHIIIRLIANLIEEIFVLFRIKGFKIALGLSFLLSFHHLFGLSLAGFFIFSIYVFSGAVVDVKLS